MKCIHVIFYRKGVPFPDKHKFHISSVFLSAFPLACWMISSGVGASVIRTTGSSSIMWNYAIVSDTFVKGGHVCLSPKMVLEHIIIISAVTVMQWFARNLFSLDAQIWLTRCCQLLGLKSVHHKANKYLVLDRGPSQHLKKNVLACSQLNALR